METESLRKFTQDLQEQLALFEKFWSARHLEDPKTWPTEMTPGEWDEQFRAWMETKWGALSWAA